MSNVKFFNSEMIGAPQTWGYSNEITSVLDACLVNGFGQTNVQSLVVSNNVATVTIGAEQCFNKIGNTYPFIRITGCSISELNEVDIRDILTLLELSLQDLGYQLEMLVKLKVLNKFYYEKANLCQ